MGANAKVHGMKVCALPSAVRELRLPAQRPMREGSGRPRGLDEKA